MTNKLKHNYFLKLIKKYEKFLNFSDASIPEFEASLNQTCKLLTTNRSSTELMDWFLDALFQLKFVQKDKKKLRRVQPLTTNDVSQFEDIQNNQTNFELGQKYLSKLAVIKLNGGLGTSMGCQGPKSTIKVTGNQSFLDLIQEQIRVLNTKESHPIDLLLMNSFNTDDLTKKESLASFVTCFLQDKIPRIQKESLLPLDETSYGDDAWCPPGHGNVYLSLHTSGQLDRLINEGKEVAFISNSDNLGATVSPAILGYFLKKKCPFLMEVTKKTSLDVKGGTLIKSNQQIKLLERAEVATTDIHLFEDISTFHYFNTNNIWIHLPSLKTLIEQKKLNLPLIFNTKTIQNQDVIQIETAMGSAIQCFQDAIACDVPRDRFLPVKKTSDLFLVQSNLYKKSSAGELVYQRQSPLPRVTFSNDYTNINSYKQLVKIIPNLLQCEELVVNGPVIFDECIPLKGKVVLENKGKEPVKLSSLI